MAGPAIENPSWAPAEPTVALKIKPKCSDPGIHEGGVEEDEAISLPPSTSALLPSAPNQVVAMVRQTDQKSMQWPPVGAD